MSAMMVESRTFQYAAARSFTPSHPRGRGFGVLSRIARGQAHGTESFDSSDETGYAPRHRRDVQPERVLRALAV